MPLMYPTKLSPAQYTSNQELVLALGPTSTVVYMLSNGNRTFFGLLNSVGGNQDGQVVCFVNITNTANWQHTFAHESSSASSPTNRFLMPGQGNLNTGTGIGSCTVIYNGALQRWLCINDTV